MSIKSPEESREHRAELTKQAIAEMVRARIYERRLHQTTVARKSGISRSHLGHCFGRRSRCPYSSSWN